MFGFRKLLRTFSRKGIHLLSLNGFVLSQVDLSLIFHLIFERRSCEQTAKPPSQAEKLLKWTFRKSSNNLANLARFEHLIQITDHFGEVK